MCVCVWIHLGVCVCVCVCVSVFIGLIQGPLYKTVFKEGLAGLGRAMNALLLLNPTSWLFSVLALKDCFIQHLLQGMPNTLLPVVWPTRPAKLTLKHSHPGDPACHSMPMFMTTCLKKD